MNGARLNGDQTQHQQRQPTSQTPPRSGSASDTAKRGVERVNTMLDKAFSSVHPRKVG